VKFVGKEISKGLRKQTSLKKISFVIGLWGLSQLCPFVSLATPIVPEVCVDRALEMDLMLDAPRGRPSFIVLRSTKKAR